MEPELSVVMFRRKGWGAEDYHSWSDKELEKGEWWCTQLFIFSHVLNVGLIPLASLSAGAHAWKMLC
jgi:hypothetical protein